MLKQFVSALAGGVMIAIGGTVFLNAYLTTQVSYIGAFFFAVALVCISMKGYGLFTDRIGYLPEQPTLYFDMTVREYLDFVYELRGCTLAREPHLAALIAQNVPASPPPTTQMSV